MKAVKQLLGNRILVKQTKVKKVGLIMLSSESVEKTQEAEVLFVGKDVEDVKVGDTVLFDKYSGTIIEDTDEYTTTLTSEDDVFAILGE